MDAIYFSGPHGAGKSSFIEAVARERPQAVIAYPDRLKFAKTNNPAARNRAKYVKYYHEMLDQQTFANENPGKVILGDRCAYDGIVYGRAFTRLGWATNQDQQKNEAISRLLFDKMPENLCVLNPPLETIVKRLETRWKSKEKKWKEENLNYLEQAHLGYKSIQDIFQGKNLLIIEQDMSLEDEVHRFYEWAEVNQLVSRHTIYQHI